MLMMDLGGLGGLVMDDHLSTLREFYDERRVMSKKVGKWNRIGREHGSLEVIRGRQCDGVSREAEAGVRPGTGT